ncbi:MAG: biotin/lipoyl-binding protein, partial [Methylococcaceae bacterium]|nr:biotin/lipoyl-binding protein [Methylococcaceae bacterium]
MMSMERGFNSKPIQALISVAGLVLLLVWMQGGFTAKTPPGTARAAEGGEPAYGHKAKAEMREIDELMAWPGTVSAQSVVQIAPRISARIVEITVKAGDRVKAGQVLARLDEQELQSRL